MSAVCLRVSNGFAVLRNHSDVILNRQTPWILSFNRGKTSSPLPVRLQLTVKFLLDLVSDFRVPKKYNYKSISF